MNWTNLFNIILNQSGLKWNEKRIRVNLFISEAESEEELRYHWEEIQMGMGMDYLNETSAGVIEVKSPLSIGVLSVRNERR